MNLLTLLLICVSAGRLTGCHKSPKKLQNVWEEKTSQPSSSHSSQNKVDSRRIEFTETQRIVFTEKQISTKGKLSKKAKKQLIKAKIMSDKAEGDIHIICPKTATSELLEEIKDIGITYNKDNSISEYILILSKK